MPLGLAFEDRVAFRGRAFVDVGPPIRMADAVPALLPSDGVTASEDDHAAVERLTAEIETHLRACAPNYDTPREEAVLQMAAKVALRPDGVADHEPDFGQVERTARRLAQGARRSDRQEVEDALADVRARPPPRPPHRRGDHTRAGPHRAAAQGRHRVVVLFLLFSPFIVIGLAANVVPYLIVRLASRRVRVPVTKGTVRMLVGIAVFPVTWIVLSVLLADDWNAFGFFLAVRHLRVRGAVGARDWPSSTPAPCSPGGRRGASGAGSPSSCATIAVAAGRDGPAGAGLRGLQERITTE